MSSYIIEGGKKLEGETYVSGSKNASLPIMAATILNKGISKLYNVPKIHDTQMMIEILKRLGCKVRCNKKSVRFAFKVIERAPPSHSFVHSYASHRTPRLPARITCEQCHIPVVRNIFVIMRIFDHLVDRHRLHCLDVADFI